MPAGLDDLSATAAVISILQAIVSIVFAIDEAFAFSQQCRRFGATCQVIKTIIERHQLHLTDERAIQELVFVLAN